MGDWRREEGPSAPKFHFLIIWLAILLLKGDDTTQYLEGCKNCCFMIVQGLSKYQPFIFLSFIITLNPSILSLKNPFLIVPASRVY